MGPIVTEVENIDELLTRLESSKLDDAPVLNRLFALPLRVRDPDAGAVGQLELVEM